jgi:hypothetical protein
MSAQKISITLYEDGGSRVRYIPSVTEDFFDEIEESVDEILQALRRYQKKAALRP